MSTHKTFECRRLALTPEARDAMMALDAQIAAEDAEDRRLQRRRRSEGLPEPARRLTVVAPGWADGGVVAREPLG